MDVGTDNETGTVSSAGVIFDTRPNHDSLSEQTRRPLCRVLAEAGQRPSLPTFEGIPLDIRVMISNNIPNTEAAISLRSASETRAQLSPRRGLPTHTWHEMGIPMHHHTCEIISGRSDLPATRAPRIALRQNTAIESPCRAGSTGEATDIFCANNHHFHHSRVRSLSRSRDRTS